MSMLSIVTDREFSWLREELHSSTRITSYLRRCLSDLDEANRVAQSPELQWNQGAAQAIAELLGFIDNPNPR